MTSASSDDIWRDDLLGRKNAAAFLEKFLVNRIEERAKQGRAGSYVVNLDSPWGEGKTFFLGNFARQLKANGFLVATVNAWRDDHAADPMVAVMSAIDDAVKPMLAGQTRLTKAWEVAQQSGVDIALAVGRNAVKHLIKKAVGEGLDAAAEIIQDNIEAADIEAVANATGQAVDKVLDSQTESLLTSFKRNQQSIDYFQRQLGSFLKQLSSKSQSLPLFVLIDELDRCRPTYAISLLERIKHLFEIDNVVFVIATDTDQLCHSIRAVYGAEFKSQVYLRRFFDRTYRFAEPSRQQFVGLMLAKNHIETEKLAIPENLPIESYLSDAFESFQISLRDIEQCFDILRTITTVWDGLIKIEMSVALPLVIAVQQGRVVSFRNPMAIAATQKHLRGLVEANGGRISAWKIPFRTNDQFGQRGRDEIVVGLDLYDQILSFAEKSLPEIVSRSVNGVVPSVIRDSFSHEFQTLYSGVSERANPPFSTVLQYPEMILSAGRLLPVMPKRK